VEAEGEISQLEVLPSKGTASYVVFTVSVFVCMVAYTWDVLCQLVLQELRTKGNSLFV
jgi:hypothetical protein